MTRFLSVLSNNRNIRGLFYETARYYAGHSHWANTRHTKAAEDEKKKALFLRIRNAMEHAIREGKSARIEENDKLRSVLDRAKRLNVPAATIQQYMTKLTDNTAERYCVEIDGLGGYTMLVFYSTNSNPRTIGEINAKAKKLRAKVLRHMSPHIFDKFCIVYAEKDSTLDKAIEDAINVGAEEVEEVEEGGTKFFQFRTTLEDGPIVLSKLKGLNYTVSSLEEMYVPVKTVALNESDMKDAQELKKRLLELEAVERVETNIDCEEPV